jgi:serine/threonine protein kinase
MTDSEQQRYAREIACFERALALAASERASFLDSACAGDEQLRAAVEALLAADDESGSTSEAWNVGLAADASGADEPALPERFGGFDILRVLGRGGMGVVYLARQTSTGREVALKVVRPELVGQSTARRRFQREIEAVSQLDHPGICTVYEAGAVGDVPFVAMRFVEGHTLADELRRSPRSDRRAREGREPDSTTAGLQTATRQGVEALLRLFEKIADALHAAHESGVLHRDVKPHNIMIDPRGEPVVLDFGLARPEETGDEEQLTMSAAQIGTPAYMSPEQIQGRALDRRTDVYSLGVTLYEALAGELPFRAPTRERMYQQILSGRIPALDRSGGRISRDLETVVRTAMAPEADRRYETARALAEDLAAVRRLEPIRARRPSVPERVVRWYRREPVVASLVAVLLLIAGFATWQAIAAERARRDEAFAAERARQEATTAGRVATFLTDLFEVADGSAYRGSTITAREVLDQGFRRIESELVDEPQIRARLMATMGQVYQHLSLFDRATTLFEQSLSLRRRHGATPRELAHSLRNLGELHHYREDYDVAERYYGEALAIIGTAAETATESTEDERVDLEFDRATVLDLLGRLHRQAGDLEASAQRHEEAFAIRRRLPERPLELARSHQSRAMLAMWQNEPDLAIQEFRAAITAREQELGRESGSLPELLHGLAQTLEQTGDREGARATAERALALTRTVYGDRHQGIARCFGLLGSIAASSGDFALAREHYEKARQVFALVFGDESREVATQLHNLGTLALDEGDLDGAHALLDRALEMRTKVLPEVHFDTGISHVALGALAARREQIDTAIAHYRNAYRILEQTLPDGHPLLTMAAGRLGQCLQVQGAPEAGVWMERAR